MFSWIKFFVTQKLEEIKSDNFNSEYDDIIGDFFLLFSVVCGQGEPLSSSEKGRFSKFCSCLCFTLILDLLDEFDFISILIQYSIYQWDYNEDTAIASAAVVSLVSR